MVAFSGVAMAGNRANLKEMKNSKECNLVLVQKKATPCQDAMIDIYEYVMNTYNSGGDDVPLLNALLSNCK